MREPVPPSDGTTNDGGALTIDDQFDLLSSRYRRYLLYALACFTPPVSLARAAETVTELLLDVPADDVPEQRLDIYMSLYHTHVPRLVENDVVTYDQQEDALEFGPNVVHLIPALERTSEKEFPDGIPACTTNGDR